MQKEPPPVLYLDWLLIQNRSRCSTLIFPTTRWIGLPMESVWRVPALVPGILYLWEVFFHSSCSKRHTKRSWSTWWLYKMKISSDFLFTKEVLGVLNNLPAPLQRQRGTIGETLSARGLSTISIHLTTFWFSSPYVVVRGYQWDTMITSSLNGMNSGN